MVQYHAVRKTKRGIEEVLVTVENQQVVKERDRLKKIRAENSADAIKEQDVIRYKGRQDLAPSTPTQET